ncbi:MAG: hypothetical protein IPI37_05450 [Bacteroidales bacterium]|nr:hypothetical protein [Bacteroidales bacterium]
MKGNYGLRDRSGYSKYSRKQIKEIFLVSPKERATCNCKILDEIDKEIDVLENKLQKYKMVKQGMMQALLTGKIRLV